MQVAFRLQLGVVEVVVELARQRPGDRDDTAQDVVLDVLFVEHDRQALGKLVMRHGATLDVHDVEAGPRHHAIQRDLERTLLAHHAFEAAGGDQRVKLQRALRRGARREAIVRDDRNLVEFATHFGERLGVGDRHERQQRDGVRSGEALHQRAKPNATSRLPRRQERADHKDATAGAHAHSNIGAYASS